MREMQALSHDATAYRFALDILASRRYAAGMIGGGAGQGYAMLTLEYKIDGAAAQYAAIEEAIRTVQFVRNKCLRLWMDADKDHPVSTNDLQK